MAVIAIGLDVVESTRARALLERHGDRIMARVLTEEERDYVESLADPVPVVVLTVTASATVRYFIRTV